MITVKSRIKTIRPGHKDFMMSDGLMVCPRASFEISANCPREFKMIIAQAIENGWVEAVAHMFDRELTMDYLRSSQ